MECKDIMGDIKTTICEDDPASTVIDFMMETRIGLIPVVDRDGGFVGLLSGDRLMHFMLPRTIHMMRGKKRAGYIRESREELKDRLEHLKKRPIRDLVDRNVEVAYTDTGLIDAMLLITGKQFVVPVLERETNRLVGAISFFTILDSLKEEES
jgi:CBS-domain-containing membrane protein